MGLKAVAGGGGSGTVTAVSVATANGLAGTSSGGTTPALTLSTTVTGVLKGNGTAISAATAGTDYIAPGGIGSNVTAVVTSQYDATSNTTLANVPGLSVNLTTGQTYTYEMHIYSNNGNTAGGVKINLSGTATASAFIGHCLSFASSGSSTGGPTFYQTSYPTSSAGVTPGGGICEMIITGYFACNGTGTLTFQFAQNASNATASSVFVGSYMNVVRVT